MRIFLNDDLNSLPQTPGVYRMLNEAGDVLYVGKANNLKKRVQSYFKKKSSQSDSKTQALVKQINAIEITITHSDTEALLLESNLIKTLRPKYNIILRDDKTYPYIHIQTTHPYPSISIFRSKEKPKKGLFFGPYPHALAAREVVQLIQKVFKLRNCSDPYFRARTRPCLQYQIKRCTAPCMAYISPEQYQQAVLDSIRCLEGKSDRLIEELSLRLEKAIAVLAFEEAAALRDQIKYLRIIQEQQGIIHLEGEADVIAIEIEAELACIQYLAIRGGQVLDSQNFFQNLPLTLKEENSWEEIFAAFIRFFYLDHPNRIPPLVLTNKALKEPALWESLFLEQHQKRCKIQTPRQGKKLRWLELAHTNLVSALNKRLQAASRLEQQYQDLQYFLGREHAIKQIECFDISHTQGTSTTAACVTFNEKGPYKKGYRHFNVKKAAASDDYAALREVIYRRYKSLLETQNFPDLLIIDGGKGQLRLAEEILAQLNIKGVSVLGIAKGPTRKPGMEHLIFEGKEMTLPSHSPLLHLLQQVRDEAHRFAGQFHRKKRKAASFLSSLETLEGIGKKRHKALIKHFGGLRELSKASVEAIKRVPGIHQALAERIFQHFH